jgi:hypothetical protein
MGATTTTVSTRISPVDPTRTLVFASGKALCGQAGGESSQADSPVGAAMGLHLLTSPTNLDVTRGVAQGTAQWSSTVLQFEP